MSVCICVRIKRRDGKILRATNHDSDVVVTATGYAGTYRAIAALETSAVQQRASLAVDSVDLTGVLALNTGISAADIANGVYDQCRITIFETDWANPATVSELGYGVAGQKTRSEEGRLTLEMRTIGQLLSQNVGDVYSTRCRATLGSGAEAPILRRCGLASLASFTFDETVTAVVTARSVFAVNALTQDAGYFSKGTVEFLDGANAGAVREIRLHDSGGILYLYDPVPFDIEIGDEVRVIAGCDKRFETCRDKFNNAANFRGEPYIPGPNYVLRTGPVRNS